MFMVLVGVTFTTVRMGIVVAEDGTILPTFDPSVVSVSRGPHLVPSVDSKVLIHIYEEAITAVNTTGDLE